MELTWKDYLMLTVLALVILAPVSYTSYRVGKWKERKDYTEAFIRATELTYAKGFSDGEISGRTKGFSEGYKKCINEDFDIRDRY